MSYNGINGYTRFDDQYYAKAQTLIDTDSEDGNGGVRQLSNTQNSVNVVGVVNAEITVLTTKTFTVDLYDSADNITFAKNSTLYTVTAGGTDTVLAVDTELFNTVLPFNAKRYSKIVITNDDTNLGKLDVFPIYIAR